MPMLHLYILTQAHTQGGEPRQGGVHHQGGPWEAEPLRDAPWRMHVSLTFKAFAAPPSLAQRMPVEWNLHLWEPYV